MALQPARLQWSPDDSLSNLDYGDIYFQPGKGAAESRYVFLEKNRLPERFRRCAKAFHIAELGFGSGLNFLLTADLFAKEAPAQTRLFFASVEKHPISQNDLEKIHARFDGIEGLSSALRAQYPPLIEGFHSLSFMNGRIRLMLMFGDVADLLPQLSGSFDAWYLDGFSPAKNEGMWSSALFPLIAARTKDAGTLATFSAAGHVRRGLSAAGFRVEKTEGFGAKRDMTVAQKINTAAQERCAPSSSVRHVAVVGARIAGCAVARALADRGFDVTVLEKNVLPPADGPDHLAGVAYPKLTVDAAPLGLYHEHAFGAARGLLHRLAPASWKPCGVLHLALGAEEKDRFRNLIARRQFPPDYAHETPEGLFLPAAGYLSPAGFCKALLEHPGIRTLFGFPVGRLEKDAAGWNLLAGQSEIRADAVVIAAGCASREYEETAWLPLQSLRGQVTFLKETPQSKLMSHVICHDGYITPAQEGVHCAGATFQKEDPQPPEVRPEDHLQNLAKLNLHLPHLGFGEKDIVGGRAGYRATTPDKLPVLGPCPDYPSFMKGEPAFHRNLYVATGFGSHGLTGASLAGEIIAGLAAGDPLPVPLPLYDHLKPERFILRELKRKQARRPA